MSQGAIRDDVVTASVTFTRQSAHHPTRLQIINDLQCGVDRHTGLKTHTKPLLASHLRKEPPGESSQGFCDMRLELHQLGTRFRQLRTLTTIERHVGDEGLPFQTVARVNQSVAAAVHIGIVNLRGISHEHELGIP